MFNLRFPIKAVFVVSCFLTLAGCANKATTNQASNSDEPEEVELVVETVDRTGQVLRHAVFFSFKDTSSEEEVRPWWMRFVHCPVRSQRLSILAKA